jgi:hypothetical protein
MDAVPEINPDDPLHVEGVAFTSIRAAEEDGHEWVEVTVADPQCGDPTFRVFNPPALVPDPSGDVERNGRRYRHDPLCALAQVIASNGGARE